ncbi:MAG TPA: alpha/beta hydrolase [Burkholderiaceae bacterium]|nr:alpha/beta hydrolase [Burkholderiaceae bacterium]
MPSSHFVNIDWRGKTIRIEYQWVGSADTTKPLIVFLHEGLGSVAMWKAFPQQLCAAANCRGLVYSRPGYGKSSPRSTDEHWQVDFMHRQAFEVLPALLSALNIDTEKHQPWLFGHSDGGSIALLFAARYAHHTSGCIVVAPHIFVEDVTVRSIEKAKLTYQTTDLRQKLSRFHDDADSAFYGWNDIWLKPEFRFWNLNEAIKTITCPLLAIQGLDDEYGSLEQIHGIKRVIPQTQLLELANCGHSPHKDQSAQVIDAVAAFMALSQQIPNQ